MSKGSMSKDSMSDIGPHMSQNNDDLDSDTLREECGVFGIFGHNDAAALTAGNARPPAPRSGSCGLGYF